MSSKVIKNFETTDELLQEAGFNVSLVGMGLRVFLNTRPVSRNEVANVLDCEPTDLKQYGNSVLVQ